MHDFQGYFSIMTFQVPEFSRKNPGLSRRLGNHGSFSEHDDSWWYDWRI